MAALAANPPPANTSLPVISGTAQDGKTLKTTNGSWSSLDTLTFSYQWQRCDNTGANCVNIAKATTSSYRPTHTDVGADITVVVSATDTETQTTQASAAPVGPVIAPVPPSNTALPVISGTVQDGQTLKATNGSWSSPDPLRDTYQWQRCDNTGANCANVTGATTNSYALTAADVGGEITVVVTATDSENQTGNAAAKTVGPVPPPPPPANTALPVITGWVHDGQTLFVADGSWSSIDPLTFTYQWQRCDSTGANCVPIFGAINESYTLGSADDGSQIEAAVSASDPENQTVTAVAAPVGPVDSGPPTGIHQIQHVVIIMQENRSFDNYFGTFPGADGIPGLAGNPGTEPCLPDPKSRTGSCALPFHDTTDANGGGPHANVNAVADIDGGAMDGFVRQVELKANTAQDVMGYFNAAEIPNYWTYAKDFVLQDHMFESVLSWSLPSHLYMVSGWSALCQSPLKPFSCVSAVQNPSPVGPINNNLDTTPTLAWTDLTYLLYTHNISWAYYVAQGTEPDCEFDNQVTCTPVAQNEQTSSIWNPLPHFEDVHQDNQLGNIQSLSNFYSAAQNGTLPAVSWIVPSGCCSEHPPALISAGQTFVTGLINQIMNSPDWGSTAIFLSWDDWGGFYDHVVPPTADSLGYGLRVPGIMISPYAKQGYIDHQGLSHDAYNKFIEDDFLGGARIDPATDGRPDPRPDVRENSSQLGDLSQEFDFTQQPMAPVVLPVCPQTDLTRPTPTC